MPNIRSYLSEILNRFAEPIERHSIQFFSKTNPVDDDEDPKSLGSGVLLKHAGNHYIATAAHVLNSLNETHIGVYTRVTDFFEVLSAEIEQSDLIDVAVWHIVPEYAAGIAPEDWWYPIERSIIHQQETPEERYFIYGFPAKKYKIDRKTKAIIQYPFRYLTRGYSASGHTRHVNYDPAINLLMEFHKTKTRDISSGRRENAPDPYGMSGCGLWYFDGLEFRLVGIMTEWKQPKERIPALMGTKIYQVLKLITTFENRAFSISWHYR